MQDQDVKDLEVIDILNKSFLKDSNPSVTKLSGGSGKGKIIYFDRKSNSLAMKFFLDDSFCNGKKSTKAQIQGGFGSAILDSVCANCVVAFSGLTETVATLEQKISFIKPIPPNTDLIAIAKILKKGRSIAFLEAELRQSKLSGTLLAKASQTVSLKKIVRKKKAKL